MLSPTDLVIYGRSKEVTQVARFDLPSLMRILPALGQGSASAFHISPLTYNQHTQLMAQTTWHWACSLTTFFQPRPCSFLWLITDRCSWSDWSGAIIPELCAEFSHLARICLTFYLLPYYCIISSLFHPCHKANITLWSVGTSPGSQCQLLPSLLWMHMLGEKNVPILMWKSTGKW